DVVASKRTHANWGSDGDPNRRCTWRCCDGLEELDQFRKVTVRLALAVADGAEVVQFLQVVLRLRSEPKPHCAATPATAAESSLGSVRQFRRAASRLCRWQGPRRREPGAWR